KTGSNPLFEVVNKNPRKIEGVGIDSDLLKILLTLGGDIHIRDKNNNTLLMKALENISDIDTIEYLINKSSNVNAQNDKGLYPINFALSYDLKISKLLIQKGARLNIKDYEGNNPLMLASENGSLETIKFLVSKGFKINDKNNLGQTALNFAVRGSNQAVIEYLINNGADATNSHLKYDLIYTYNTSFRNVLFENIDLLLKGGFDINEVDKDGNNLLIKTNSKNISTSFLDYIITKGFDINHKNNFGENILFSELKKDINSEVIIFLLNKNIDINNKNKNAFELFLESESTNEEILLKFLNKNNRPLQSEYRYLFHKKSDFLDTVLKNIDLDYYLKDIKFINSLFNYLVANKIKNNLINTLISKGFDLNTKNSDGDTLLIKSILDNNPNLFNQ
ncbi:MAG: ankyrin repeat domain-containing protein, partial [Candidatus Sericytochromatia bacterium]